MTVPSPSPNRSRPPRFFEMDDEAFEELCCALFDKEPNIQKADRYRAPRECQFGIDILGERVGGGVEVVSCKCCSVIKKSDIPTWCDDFLKHWDTHWKDQGVRRFVLAVAVDVRSERRQAEIKQQRDRFRALGVEFDVWAPRQLQEKLRPYRGIASQYLTEVIANQLCGNPQSAVTQPILDSVVVAQLSRVQATLAEELDQHLDAALEGLKRGNGTGLDKALDVIQSDPHPWGALPPEAQARVVRLRAARELERGNPERVQQLADEADQLAGPAKGWRLRASIAARCGDPRLGLKILRNPASSDDRRLQAALLLAIGEPAEALTGPVAAV